MASGDPQRLSPGVLAAIEAEIGRAAQPGHAPGLLVSAISRWEVALLLQRGRLAFSLAVAATRLPDPFPADRFLVAQARELALPLLSADLQIRDCAHGQSLWG